ncbi:MAG: transporter substrate-binding domain-containing protein [Pseudomonadota bacterium]
MRLAAISLICVSALALGAGQPRTFTIGVEDLQYYPLHTIDAANEYRGYAREVLDLFAHQQGYQFHYVPLPINRLYLAFLQDGSVDFKYPDNPKWKPELRGARRVRYSAAVVTSEEGAMVLPRQRGRPFSQLRTLGTALGFTPWPYLSAIESKTVVLTTASGFDGLLRHALAAHLDAVYVNVDVANYLLAEAKLPGALVFDPGLPHARSDFSLATLRYPQVLAEFDQFLRREQVQLQKLRKKYGIEERGP